MNEAARRQRNTRMLAELNPVFAGRIEAIIATLEREGMRPRIQCAWRSPQDQLAAYQSGHSKLRYGFHNVSTRDGGPDSLAVDLLDDDHPLDMGTHYLLRLAAVAQQNRCGTGIRWGLPARLVEGIEQAIACANWDAPVKVGWDPSHVQPADVSVVEARAGKRPRA